MSALILDGKESARKVKSEVSAAVAELDYQPGLATVLVGDDPASHTYVRMKGNACARVGMESLKVVLPEATTTEVARTSASA